MTAPAIAPTRLGRRPQTFSLIVFAPLSNAANPRKNVFDTLSALAAENNGTLRLRRGRGAIVPTPKAGSRGPEPKSMSRTFVATFRSSGSLEAFVDAAADDKTLRFGETVVEDATGE